MNETSIASDQTCIVAKIYRSDWLEDQAHGGVDTVVWLPALDLLISGLTFRKASRYPVTLRVAYADSRVMNRL
jgi:hypothetical protein